MTNLLRWPSKGAKSPGPQHLKGHPEGRGLALGPVDCPFLTKRTEQTQGPGYLWALKTFPGVIFIWQDEETLLRERQVGRGSLFPPPRLRHPLPGTRRAWPDNHSQPSLHLHRPGRPQTQEAARPGATVPPTVRNSELHGDPGLAGPRQRPGGRGTHSSLPHPTPERRGRTSPAADGTGRARAGWITGERSGP